jgi:hypothetical protein
LFRPILAKPIGLLAAAFGLGGVLELTIFTRSGLGLSPDPPR